VPRVAARHAQREGRESTRAAWNLPTRRQPEQIAQAVCLDSTKLQILVKAVEPDQASTLVGRVLDSVRFGN
jgi:hypothetical protein